MIRIEDINVKGDIANCYTETYIIDLSKLNCDIKIDADRIMISLDKKVLID